jgi:FAD synthase
MIENLTFYVHSDMFTWFKNVASHDSLKETAMTFSHTRKKIEPDNMFLSLLYFSDRFYTFVNHNVRLYFVRIFQEHLLSV